MLRCRFFSTALIVICSVTPLTHAATVSVEVLDRDNAPLAGAVVSIHGSALPEPEPMQAVIGQDELRFTPQVLMVTRGSEVSFTNQDEITHHVYSFSRPWKKQFRLKQGDSEAHTLDKAGTVVLGCNVHDWMLGYVYVMNTPVFGTTNNLGFIAHKDIPAGSFVVRIQHPRIRDGRGVLEREIELREDQQLSLTVQLKKALLPPRNQVPDLDSYQ